jgi:selenocysteine-specific elongation factor
LTDDDSLERASASLYFAGLRDWRPQHLARSAGIQNIDEVTSQLSDRGDLIQFDLSPTRTMRLHDAVLRELSDRVRRALEQLHAQFPLRRSVERARLASRFDYLGSGDLLDAVLDRMSATGQVSCTPQGVTLSGHGPQLSKNQQQLLGEIVRWVHDGGCQPPFIAEIRQQISKNQSSVPELLALAAAEGELVKINKDFYLHHDIYQSVREKLVESLEGSEGLKLSEIRELLETSRKFAVPLCEHFDEIGFTRRLGDRRVLANVSPTT